MADRRVMLSALVASRLGLTEPAKAVWVQRRRPSFVRNARGAILPVEQEYATTADVVIDDPREPRIEPTGVLDERGKMLCRVTVPVKTRMGFHVPAVASDIPEEVQTVMPEDLLAIVDVPGMGLGYIDISELGAFGGEDEEGAG